MSEKEKQTLRLIVRGHDAKSTARSLGLSVHTINERLRDVRRKMAVSSSREAARLLFEAEGDAPVAHPESSGDNGIGEAAGGASADPGAAPDIGVGRRTFRRPEIIGGLLMASMLGLLALTLLPQATPSPPPATVSTAEAPDQVVVESARQWLLLLDQGRWADSYQATAAAFRKLNTVERWAAASQRVRVPLGAVVSRSFVSQDEAPTPPHGYQLVKFRTTFTNKADAIETVALDRENGRWRVVGVTVG